MNLYLGEFVKGFVQYGLSPPGGEDSPRFTELTADAEGRSYATQHAE